MKTILLILTFVLSYAEVTSEKVVVKENKKENKKEELLELDKLTVYYADKKQCDEDYWITADGSIIDTLNPMKHKWIALSQDLIKEYPYGTFVELVDAGRLSGIYCVTDCMNKRFTNRIDVLVSKSYYKKYKVINYGIKIRKIKTYEI